MVVDTSALCAVFFEEEDRARYLGIIARIGEMHVSAATSVECSIVIMRRMGSDGEARARAFFERANLRIVPFDETQATMARQAFQLYGKGRHRAGLNLGDCFSYALAKSLGEPLLFKGDDFRLTDVIPAL